jgi:dihydropteroate synthase
MPALRDNPAMHMHWQTTRFAIALEQPRVMGIVNVTPDSFSDGGRFASTRTALEHCEQLIAEGADILDLGGESSRPGIPPVSLEEERARVMPVLREAVRFGVPISVDTCKPEIMREALDLGVDIVNDIWALRQPGALDVVAAHASCGVCLMHMHGEPMTMQRSPLQGDAVPQVRDFLRERSDALRARGVSVARIAWDPGIGFGKTVEQNFALLARQRELLPEGYPLLAGWSRKSSLGQVTGVPVQQRMVPSVAAALLAVDRGAAIVRVHDVRETVAALQVWSATQAAQGGQAGSIT